MWPALSPEAKREIEEKGLWLCPSDYGDGPYPITRALIEDGQKNLLLDKPIEVGCPVRILQGALDSDVPWQHALRLVSCLAQDDVVLTLIMDGYHRLSRPEDIQRLLGVVDELAAAA
jgi:dipeptidyl aminopeptidase/acylaminoacyl peptidase